MLNKSEEHCRDHRCERYHRDSDRNYDRDRGNYYDRDRGNYYSEQNRHHRQRYSYYDGSAHQWRYGYR